jgi:tRNA nucleotidyltransferase (CCA-adding enzyme)
MIKPIHFKGKKFLIDVFNDQIYLVGGTIRDYFLYGNVDNHKDIDLIVTDHSYEQLENKLISYGKSNTVGKSFAVLKFTRDNITYDISIPRKDSRSNTDSFSHKNFHIDSGVHVSLEEDLSRRDFTCNSMALNLKSNQLFDPFNGNLAIQQMKLLMTNKEVFADDPLRLLRAARFSATHGFLIDNSIYQLAGKIILKDLSIERIQEELFRLLLESLIPSKGLAEYFKLGILEQLFQELYPLTLTIQDALFHPETDEQGHHSVWIHSLLCVDIAKKCTHLFQLNPEESLCLMLAALLHDLGKIQTTRWEYKRGRMTITSIHHDVKGSEAADSFLSRFKIDHRNGFALKKIICKLIRNHHRIFDLYRNKNTIGFKAFSRLVRDLDGYEKLLVLLDFCDRHSRFSKIPEILNLDEISQWFYEKQREYNINFNSIQPLLHGRDLINLGIKPGKQMGIYLKELYEKQLDGVFSNKEQGIALFLSWYQNK